MNNQLRMLLLLLLTLTLLPGLLRAQGRKRPPGYREGAGTVLRKVVDEIGGEAKTGGHEKKGKQDPKPQDPKPKDPKPKDPKPKDPKPQDPEKRDPNEEIIPRTDAPESRPQGDDKQAKGFRRTGMLIRELIDRVRIGGYFDLEYHSGDTDDDTFRQHRLVLLAEAKISERATFATEIEFEDGSETHVEFAALDYRFVSWLNFRGGIILDPLGRLNLYHDSPYQEFTDRPLMHRTVIPTTLREPGAGFFGTFFETGDQDLRLNYEVYGAIGFKGLDDSGTAFFDRSSGLRNGAPYKDAGGSNENRDNNDNLAFVGRVNLESSFQVYDRTATLETGFSWHTGKYDEDADNRLTILAADARLAWGHLEILGEYAFADLDRDTFARASGIPGDMWGWYVQADYKWFPDFLGEWEDEGYLGEGSHFTFGVRHGRTDLDGAGRYRTSLGINFRPNRSMTVFKAEYQFNEETGTTPNDNNSGFVFSVATYF